MKSFIPRSRKSAAASRVSTAALLAFALAASMYAIPEAQQSPHGGSTVKPQPGPNVNAAGGIVDPKDPAAVVKADLLLQRQNETVVAASTRNPDAVLAAWNDYRFVDFTIGDDGHGGQPSPFITRLLAKLFVRPFMRPVPRRAAMSVGAWTGVGRTCDRGNTWIGGVLPGGPLDNSPASLNSPLKALSNLAETQGGHAETTDPVLVAAPGGKMHLFVLGFIRFPNGFVGESRMYHSLYTHRNNHEGGACFNYEWTVEVDNSLRYGPTAFLDKGSAAVDKDGTLYFAYTAFTDAEKSKIVVARLPATPGASWQRTVPAYNFEFLRNHGTTIAVDSRGGVHVAWRLFYEKWPLMVISHSYDRGKTFWPATPISHWWPSKSLKEIIQMLKAAKLQPFDQFTSAPGEPETARALGLPNLVAGAVNGQPKLFAVWQERVDVNPASSRFGFPSATGSPRAVLSMSTDGFRWTERRAVDIPSGPQVQPVLSISGRTNPQLLLAYYQARKELNWPFELNFISGIDRQMDLRVARINPVTGALISPSVQVSQYSLKANTNPPQILDTAAPGVPQANFENLTVYERGNSGFFGDYPSIVPSAVFERSSSTDWAQDPSSSYVIWTDNRDVRFPPGGINGDWTAYTPVKPGALPATCSTVGMRNANPYFAEIAGAVAGSLQNFKPLNIQRAFATYYENRTPQDRFFRLTVLDDEAAGIDASFDQFDFAQDVLDVQILAYSSRAHTVWVQPNHANPTAPVRILMQEIDAMGAAAPKAGGYGTSLKLNPDPTNPALDNVPPTAPVPPGTPTGIDVSEIHTPQVAQPQVAQLHVSTPQVAQPQVAQPQVAQPQVAQPQVAQPQVAQQQMAAPQVAQPQVAGDDDNATDVTVTVTNGGTTSTVYNAFVHVPNADALLANDNYNFVVLLTRTSLVPSFTQQGANCVSAAEMKLQVLANIQVHSEATADGTIKNPQVAQPQVAQPGIATFALAPEGGAVGQNSHGDPANEDSHSTVLPIQTNITVRAIRNKPIAQILASGGQLFNPNDVVFRVDSSSTDVINGVVGADGTQPSAITLRPDLAIVNYTPASPALSAPPGGSVTLSSWRVQNNGGAPTPPSVVFSNGFYLSTDSVITAGDTLLAVNSNTSLAPGAGFNWSATSHTIPSNTPPGNYFIGILADYAGEVSESDEGNNYVSEPITVTGSGLAAGDFIVGDGVTNFTNPSGSLFRVSADGSTVTTLATLSACPSGVAVNGSGNFLVNDPCSSPERILEVTPSGASSTFFAGGLLQNPVAIVRDGTSHIIVGDNVADKLFRITPDGATIAEFKSLPNPSPSSAQSLELAVDRAGNVIVGYDSLGDNLGTSEILRISPDGATTTTVVTGDTIGGISGLAIESSGDYIVADYVQRQIVRVNATTGAVTTIVNDQVALCCNVVGLTIDGSGDFITTVNGVTGDPRVLKITPAGAITTLRSGSPLTATRSVNVIGFVPSTHDVADLGVIGSGSTFAHAVNDSGEVVGESQAANGDLHAFRYSNATMTDLGTLSGSSGSAAYAINASGISVGQSYTGATGTPPHAVRFDDGAVIDLGTLGGSNSAATGINSTGQIVGSSLNDSGSWRAFFHYDGMNDLDTLSDGGDSFAFGINDDGLVVGCAVPYGSAVCHAVLFWDGVLDLGTLGGNYSAARAINGGGRIVGESNLAAGGPSRAFLYDLFGSMQHLGTLGGADSQALAVNAAGQVVGVAKNFGGADRAFLFANGTMIDLNTLLPPGSGWVLHRATGINSAGQIVGTGIHNGSTRGFLLSPPSQ
jgi:probable HAF family extracellular repeat protein